LGLKGDQAVSAGERGMGGSSRQKEQNNKHKLRLEIQNSSWHGHILSLF
jgi:hypothetical protein